MARTDKRYCIYPNPQAIKIVGRGSTDLNVAVECWSQILSQAKVILHPLDWGVLAPALKETRIDPQFQNPGQLLRELIERMNGWSPLGAILEEMSYPQSWYVITSVQWYWKHAKHLPGEAPWWDLEFRQRWVPPPSPNGVNKIPRKKKVKK